MAFGFLKKAVRTAGKGLKSVGKATGKVAGGALKITGKVVSAPVKVARKIPVVKEVVKGAGAVVKTVGKASSAVGKTLGKVPIAGPALKGVYNLTANAPFQAATDIARGKNLNTVALNAVKRNVSAVRDVAPYAQTVIAIVPGVGTSISAGLGAGLALASGQPITEAIAAGVRGAIPGGALAKAAFDVGKAAIEGKSLTGVALAALPINTQQKNVLAIGLNAAGRMARGERVDKALIAQADGVIRMLPKDVGRALDIGIAVAEGKNLQTIAKKHVAPAVLSSLKTGGANLINTSPTLAAAGKVIQSPALKTGYSIGVGMMAHTLQPFQVVAIRSALKPEERQGFDMAVAARSGMVDTHGKKPAAINTPEKAFGYVVTAGLKGTTNAAPIAKAVANPKLPTAAGAKVALEVIKEQDRPWYQRLARWMFGKEPK